MLEIKKTNNEQDKSFHQQITETERRCETFKNKLMREYRVFFTRRSEG